MATVTCSIGQSASLGTITPSSCTAVTGTTDEWDVTFSTSPMPTVSVGDTWNASDYSGSDYTFLFIPVGSGYRLKYVGGGWSVTSPCSVTDFMGNQASGTLNRAFSTLSSWESSLDSGDFSNLYSSGDDAVGECYDDATSFNWNVSFTGASSLGNIKLTVADGERHGGDESSGVTIAYTGTSRKTIQIDRDDVTVEWLVLDFTSANNANFDGIFIETNKDTDIIIRNNILHGFDSQNDRVLGIKMANGDSSSTQSLLNNVLYDFYQNNDHAIAIAVFDSSTKYEVYNNTVYKMISGSNNDYGIGFNNRGYHVLMKNNIAIECRNNNSSATYSKCFRNYSGTTDDDTKRNYNYSSDSTALGTDSYTSQTAANTFQSVTGAIDLSLVSDSNAVDNGVDLGTTNGVNIDVTGRDRDADTNWSIGAYQFAPAGDTVTPAAAQAIATGASPTVTSGLELTPATAVSVATSQAPTTTSGQTITPAVAVSVATGQSPTISSGLTVTPASAVSVATVTAPTLTTGIDLSPAVAVFVATGTSPTISSGGTVSPASAVAIATGTDPTVTEGEGGDTVTPAAAIAVATGASPTMTSGGTVTPAVSVAVATGTSPSISSGSTFTPSVAASIATVTSPTITSGLTLSNIVAAAVAAAQDPTVSTGGDATVTPNPAVIVASATILPIGAYGILYITDPQIRIPSVGSALLKQPSATSTIVSSKEE